LLIPSGVAFSLSGYVSWWPVLSRLSLIGGLLPLAFLLGDVIHDFILELFLSPHKNVRHLPLTTRLAAVMHGLAIRTASEMGRLRGHADRGKLTNLGWRFNWFGDMWQDARKTEIRNAMWRNVGYVAIAAVVIGYVMG